MVQPLFMCLCSFCGDWRGFVSRQFRTRYSGHTLSRLAEFSHNRTKQHGFPTIRRKELKSWNYNSSLVGLCTSMGELYTKVEINWVCLCGSERGWLACPLPNQWCISVIYRICWFGMDFILAWWVFQLKYFLGWSVGNKSRAHTCCLQGVRKCGLLAVG